MNIGILVKEFPPTVIGGTELQTQRMAAELNRGTEHEVTVYTKAYQDDQPDVPFDIVRIPNWKRSPFISTLTFLVIGIFYLVRDHNDIDILQCMMIYPTGFMGLVLKKLTATPYFAWIRGGDYYLMKDHPIKRRAIRSVLKDTLVLVQAESIREDVLSEFPSANEIEILGNGVEIPEEVATGEYVLYLGRLHEKKGVEVLLRAAEPLNESLLIIGDGDQRGFLESLANRLELDVKFVGEVPQESVVDYLCRGKVFVLPSNKAEGLPNAVLEAMATGLPVIATDTGGVRDLIDHGEIGYVVEPGDIDEIRERLAHLSENPQARESMGKNAREYVEHHHAWSRIIVELDKIYSRLSKER
jgi:glycosyltransferase involved in cell wall biosynthesis